MTMMTARQKRKKLLDDLRKQLEAEEAAAQEADREEERQLTKIKRAAGDAHVRVVLDLYELLGVEPEHPTTRATSRGETEVATDRREELRTQRLFALVEGLVEDAGAEALELRQLADAEGRDARRAERQRDRGTRSEVGSDQDEEDEEVKSQDWSTPSAFTAA